MESPAADVSVRVAWADDAAAIADIQSRAWRAGYADLLPTSALASLDTTAMAAAWHAAMTRPPDARHRVLVALAGNAVVGFATTGPAPDPDCSPIDDAEIAEFTVDPEHRGHGHGSRLLQACVDTVVADRFRRALWWLRSTDDASRRFLISAGWAADGAHRELDLEGDGAVRVRQIRLHTAVG